MTTVHRKAAMARFEGVNEKHEHTLTYYNEEDEKGELSNLTVEGRATRHGADHRRACPAALVERSASAEQHQSRAMVDGSVT